MGRIAKEKNLPAMVGFCQYRKYFAFMNQVPSNLSAMECVVGTRVNLGKTIREQYATFGNVEDLDIATKVIEKHYPKFSAAWHQAINSREFHPCSMFIMPRDKFCEMIHFVAHIIRKWADATFGYPVITAASLSARIKANPEKYHLKEMGFDYAYRIGGQLGERLISAWIDWQFPKAIQYNIKTVSEK